MEASSSRIHTNSQFETIVDPSQGLIPIPLYFNEVWKKSKCKTNSSKIASAGKLCNVQLSFSDENVMFYGYKVAEFFGFTKPTRVLMEYIIERNIFCMVVLEDVDSAESRTGPEIICIGSSDEEDDNQQEIEIQEKVNTNDEVIRIVYWSKTVTNAMVAERSKQSLHFPKHVATRFLQYQHVIILNCLETDSSYKCKIESSKQPDENGFYKKRIGEGWYKFKEEHNLQAGDNLRFELSFYPYILNVRIERKAC